MFIQFFKGVCQTSLGRRIHSSLSLQKGIKSKSKCKASAFAKEAVAETNGSVHVGSKNEMILKIHAMPWDKESAIAALPQNRTPWICSNVFPSYHLSKFSTRNSGSYENVRKLKTGAITPNHSAFFMRAIHLKHGDPYKDKHSKYYSTQLKQNSPVQRREEINALSKFEVNRQRRLQRETKLSASFVPSKKNDVATSYYKNDFQKEIVKQDLSKAEKNRPDTSTSLVLIAILALALGFKRY